jgi:hypothetical protein
MKAKENCSIMIGRSTRVFGSKERSMGKEYLIGAGINTRASSMMTT